MAYLNCPFCPSQAYPVKTETFPQIGWGMEKYQCISKHEFYVRFQREDK